MTSKSGKCIENFQIILKLSQIKDGPKNLKEPKNKKKENEG